MSLISVVYLEKVVDRVWECLSGFDLAGQELQVKCGPQLEWEPQVEQESQVEQGPQVEQKKQADEETSVGQGLQVEQEKQADEEV